MIPCWRFGLTIRRQSQITNPTANVEKAIIHHGVGGSGDQRATAMVLSSFGGVTVQRYPSEVNCDDDRLKSFLTTLPSARRMMRRLSPGGSMIWATQFGIQLGKLNDDPCQGLAIPTQLLSSENNGV